MFFLRFVVHIHALRKNRFKVLKSMDPKMLANNLFHHASFFLREREIPLSENFPFFLFTFYLDSSKARIETAWTEQRGHLTRCAMKCDLCLLCMLCKFYYSKRREGLALSPAWTWGLYPTNLKSFLQVLVHKRYASKAYGCITPKFINQNSTPCQIWLKKVV